MDRASGSLTPPSATLVGAAVQDVWAGVERIVAIGDVHGDYEQFVAVLRSAKLIDSVVDHLNKEF